jgi:hypothetical protein
MQKPAGLRRDITLFWISCFLLFFEIMMIRWLSAEIRIFSYFNNLVLLFCFLGMGLGCALASRKGLPMLLSFVIAALLAGLVRLDAYRGRWRSAGSRPI